MLKQPGQRTQELQEASVPTPLLESRHHTLPLGFASIFLRPLLPSPTAASRCGGEDVPTYGGIAHLTGHFATTVRPGTRWPIGHPAVEGRPGRSDAHSGAASHFAWCAGPESYTPIFPLVTRAKSAATTDATPVRAMSPWGPARTVTLRESRARETHSCAARAELVTPQELGGRTAQCRCGL